MNITDLENDYMLKHDLAFYLPPVIESDYLEEFAVKLSYTRKIALEKPIRLYCRCSGGAAEAGIAITNLIIRDGNVNGILIGESCSMGSVIWASCAKRFVYPRTLIGVHEVAWQGADVSYNTSKLHAMWQEFDAIDRRCCEILAAASNCDYGWWWEFYHQNGDIKWLDAAQLVSMGMATPVERVQI